MSWRFRKSFSPLPGVRLTVSRSGISTSLGVGPLRFTSGPRGQTLTARIPGSGLSFNLPLGDVPPPLLAPPPPSVFPELQEVRSAGTGCLTTPGLTELRRLLIEAARQQSEISHELARVQAREGAAVRQFKSWEHGWLLRRLFRSKYKRLKAATEELSAHRAELEEQERLSKVRTDFDLPRGIDQAYHRLRDDFFRMAQAHSIWDTVGARSTNRVVERTTASRSINRKPVRFRLNPCMLIEATGTVPHLENANGGDLFLYPTFAIYFVGPENFALIEYKDIRFTCSRTQFVEEQPVPADSTIAGYDWAKSNKDGSRDLRFKGNYQIPVAWYATLAMTSETGLNEEYLISNVESTEVFASSWQNLLSAINVGA